MARGQSLLCDLASTFITAAALNYGTDIRPSKKTDIAVVATSILLLLNLSDVLKAILDAAIQVETFFRLNIVLVLLSSFLLWKWLPFNRINISKSTRLPLLTSISTLKTPYLKKTKKLSLKYIQWNCVFSRVNVYASTKKMKIWETICSMDSLKT